MKDPDRISIVKSAGVFALLGGFWFLGAIVTVLLAASPPPDPTVPAGVWAWTAVMATVMGALGLALALARMGVDIDRGRRTASRWFGPLFPLFARTEPLERFDHVLLSKTLRRERSGWREYYRVHLAGAGVTSLAVEQSKDPVASRARGEEVARFLSLPLRDETGDAPIVREPGALDESLRTRVRRGGPRPAPIERPAGARTRVVQSSGELRVEIPPAGFRWFQIAILVAIAALTGAGVVAVTVLAGPEDRLPGLFSVVATGALNFLITFVYFAAPARARATVVATPSRLQVRHIGLVWSRTSTMPVDELEELEIELGTHTRLAARSDRASIHFGKGLSVTELAWLRGQLYDILLGA